MKNTTKVLAGLAAGCGLLAVAASATGVAVATPGSGIVDVQFVARADFKHPTDIA
jgi:hypothetical protein